MALWNVLSERGFMKETWDALWNVLSERGFMKDTWDALWNVLSERGFMKETWDALWNVLSERGFMKETWDALWNVLSERGFMKDMWDALWNVLSERGFMKETWDALWNVLSERGFMKETWDALWNVLSERGFMKETWDALWNVLSERGFMKDTWDALWNVLSERGFMKDTWDALWNVLSERGFMKDTWDALWNVLSERGFMKYPAHETEWTKIAQYFESRWNFPNCIGAMHVVMQAPARSGSYFYNYKGTHSIVLMAVVNAHYEFTLVSIGDSGRQSDGGVFAVSHIGYAMGNNLLKIPKPRCPNGSNKPLPYVLVGDEAFPFREYLVKPYTKSSLATEQRITNLRISRARNVVENVFGICASHFRVLRRSIIGKVQTVETVTKAVVILHNFLMFGREVWERSNYAEGEWRRDDVNIDGCNLY